MLAVKSANVRDNLNEAEYNALQKAKRNAEYQEKLQRGISALNSGMGVEHELIEDFGLF